MARFDGRRLSWFRVSMLLIATRDVVLSFVVASPASPASPCTPSWGPDYSLDSASNEFDLDRRVERLRQNKGYISVSFGGAANSEIAALNAFARDKGITRLSMCSLNRDRSCGANYPHIRVVSNSCSGVDRGSPTFAAVLRSGFIDGNQPSAEHSVSAPTPLVSSKLPAGTYQKWDAGKVYTKGERVMFDGIAFAAKSWSQGEIPAERSSQSDPSPWIQLTEAQLRKAAAGADNQFR